MTKKVKIFPVVEICFKADETNYTAEEQITKLITSLGMQRKYKNEKHNIIQLGFVTSAPICKDINTIPIVELSISGDKNTRYTEMIRMMQIAEYHSAEIRYKLEKNNTSVVGFFANNSDALSIALKN